MRIKVIDILKIISLLIIISIYVFTSIKDLDKDVINPDGINWHNRTQAFVDALSRHDYGETFQAYHPGTSLMWISGPLLNVFKPNLATIQNTVDPKTIFLEQDYYAKLSVVIFCTLIFILTLIVLWKMISFKYATFYAVIFTLEPFLIGMRRLYHLDYLMTVLLFLSFLLLIYYNYKSSKWFLLITAGMCFSLALLTKSTAIIFLPAVPFIFILGNSSLLKKMIGLTMFIMSAIVFLYLLFPPIWKNPLHSIPKYYEQIVLGVRDIGLEGKQEIGVSGKSQNILLETTLENKISNFYLISLFMRLSPAGVVLLVISVSLFIYIFLKGIVLTFWNSIKNRLIPKAFNYRADSWLSFWSLGISIAALLALTLSVKKSDRYEVLVFPFLITLVAYLFSKLKWFFYLLPMGVYIGLVLFDLNSLHPYYLAHSNPYLGGIDTRLRVLDTAPFGIGTYAAFDIVKNDMETSGYFGYYTISGSKSIKAISAGGKFSRFPSCVTDYVISYALEDKPSGTCIQRYSLLDTVKISGFDYWYVYKRVNQQHASNYD